MAKRDLVDAASFGLEALVRDVRKILGTTLGTMALEDLRQHESMLRWVKDGMDNHQEHDLSSCLLCGNELTAESITALRQIIGDKFDQLTGDIADAKEKAEQLRDCLGAMKGVIVAF